MASGSTGAPWNIPYPVGSDQYALTADLTALASVAGVGMSRIDTERIADAVFFQSSLSGKASTAALASAVANAAGDTAAARAEFNAKLAGVANAYDVAVRNGFVGSVSAWLASLKGATGARGPEGPAGGTAVTDPAVAAMINDAGTATGTAVEKRYRRSISVVEYGATGDGVTNDAPAINAAINACAAQGGGEVFFPPGVYSAGGDIVPASGVHLKGASAGASKLIVPIGNTTRNSIIARVTATWIDDVTISDLGFEGRWEDNYSQVAANGLITLKYVRRLRIERCILRNSRAFTVNINVCSDVVVRDNVLENGARDMIAVWGTPNVSITGNRIAHNDDDCISVSWEGQIGTNPIRSQIVVSNNHLSDTGGIRTQVPSGAVIEGNTLHRTRGMGIYLSIINASKTNTGTAHSNIVRGNVIRDVIDRYWNLPTGASDGSLNQRTYIMVDSTAPQTGGESTIPGQPDALGAVPTPYNNNYSVATMAGNVGPIRMPHGVIVEGNICKRTLPPVDKYSDWGYGKGYSLDGWLDRPVIDRDLQGVGVRIALPISSLLVANNVLEPGGRGIHFNLFTGVTLTNRLAQGVVIQGNAIRDTPLNGIHADLGGLSHQDIQLVDNLIDCDPLFRSANRRAGGTWSGASVTPLALELNNLGGVFVARNTVRNAGAAIRQGGAITFQNVMDNMVAGEAAALSYSAANKGVGTVPSIGHGKQWWFMPEGSDPAAANYGQSLGALIRDNSAMPSSGTWLAGMFVYSRVQGTNSGKYTLGWLRLTSGSSHVAGTDWIPVYATTS